MIRALRGVLLVCLIAAAAAARAAGPMDPALFSGMRWRLVGPFRGGRALATTGVAGEPNRFYFGAVGGGVWKSENAGRTWEPIFDAEPIASIGAVAVAPSNPRVLYVGSGEADMRSDISYGNGVYKSVDGGKSWRHVGLADSRQVGRILVDPRDPDVVFVAALGHAYGPNTERGVFRSRDGGRAWTRVLFKDENTGAIDLAFDPGNAKTIFAALWATRRPPWNAYPPSNGPGSGLYRSDDGGETWRPVAGGGFPSERLGRIGIAFAPSDPRRVYALVDAKEGGLYASEDGGSSWKRASADRRIWERGWYFGGLTVDPKDANVVYACNTALYRSRDGGKTFVPFKGAPGGDDYHQLWIDPGDSRRMIVASDQGTVVSVDGGATWSSWYNQPTAQFYHVAADGRNPYWIYGAQQDTGAAAIPFRTDYPSISSRDWRPIAVGGENGYIVPDPSNSDIVYGGTVGRFDWKTLQDQNVDPTLAYPGDHRAEWTLPLAVSPRNPRVLYFGNQFVFRTTDAGRHWEKISPDLTREAPTVPAALDPATVEDSAVRGPRRGVVYAIAPSPLDDGLVWCGTDDGLVWVTHDGGKRWENVTPRGLSAWSKVGILEASRFDAGTVYAAVDRHRLDDLAPYVYRTRDGGRTWSAVAQGIPAGSYVNVVREDPERRGLLYAGTETGVFVSFDDGDRWQPLRGNLPNCSVRDIVIQRDDLVIATHGRSFWVMDDLSPLRQLDGIIAASEAWLFAPREAVRLHPAAFQGTPDPKDEPTAENPPRGAFIDYYLKDASASPVSIEILDPKGGLVRRFASDVKPERPDLQKIVVTPDWVPAAPTPEASAGMHRFVWDLRYPAAEEIPKSRWTLGPTGLWAPPGRYTVRLTAGGQRFTQPLVVAKDPRIAATDADLLRQFDLGKQVEADRVRVAVAAAEAASLRRQASSVHHATGEAATALDAFRRALFEVAGPAADEDELFDEGTLAPTSLRRLSASLSRLQGAIESSDAAPTPDAQAGFAQRHEAVSEGLDRWKEFLASELPRLNRALGRAGLPAMAIKTGG